MDVTRKKRLQTGLESLYGNALINPSYEAQLLLRLAAFLSVEEDDREINVKLCEDSADIMLEILDWAEGVTSDNE